jgi:uncharacterized protein YjiS (DUF1127 family)
MITQDHIDTVLAAAFYNLGHPLENAALWQEHIKETPLTEEQLFNECERLLREQQGVTTTWDSVRRKRNQLLTQSDWTQLADAPLTQEQKNAWAVYRQALRDVPSSAATPEEVVWPTAPV